MPVARKKLTPVRLVPVGGWQRHQPNALPAGTTRAGVAAPRPAAEGTTRAGETLGRAGNKKVKN